MKNLGIDVASLPDIGTEVLENGLDISRVDTIYSYVIKNISKNIPDIYVVLNLETYTRPRLSVEIPLSSFSTDWTIVEKKDTLDNHKGKKPF